MIFQARGIKAWLGMLVLLIIVLLVVVVAFNLLILLLPVVLVVAVISYLWRMLNKVKKEDNVVDVKFKVKK